MSVPRLVSLFASFRNKEQQNEMQEKAPGKSGLRRLALALVVSWPVLAVSLEPFGAGLQVPAARGIAPVEAVRLSIGCLEPPDSLRWEVELPADGPGDAPFRLERAEGKNVIRISTGALVPARSTVRILLPGDGPANGDEWAKRKADHVSFRCKSDRPVRLTFHLLQRGKSAGTWQTGFTAHPGAWRRVVLPLAEFRLRSFANVAGIGVRAVAGEPAAQVMLTDFAVGSLPFADSSWQARRMTISLRGDWLFAADAGEEGMENQWFADGFDDSSWRVLKSGRSWEQQGVEHYGWGWYRQRIFIPEAFAGTPLILSLAPTPADDDVWFNGERVGGFSGECKYRNWITRTYTVPAALIRYGAENTIAMRFWGGDITFIGAKSGLVNGPLQAELDPYRVRMREPGGEAVPTGLFDLGDAQRGKPFEIVFPFPAELAGDGVARLHYKLADRTGNTFKTGMVPLTVGRDGEGTARAVVRMDRDDARTLYLRGYARATLLIVEGDEDTPLYCGTRELDHLPFLGRDTAPLPVLPAKMEETPYGRLKLVDEIDCAVSLPDDPHPCLQGGFDHAYNHMTPGAPVETRVATILGKRAREAEYGWFAYRIGRGKLRPRSTYLLRIEYPEDKPRFCPVEIQAGQNYMDVGWKNGVAADDPYDNWPLSGRWEWFDAIFPLDDQTVGTGGTGSAPAENGVWVYFMNKLKPGQYYAMWSGGPAVARIRLYEIDPERNAPKINRPEGLPQRLLSFDWERQPDHDPEDLVRYARLMGYNAVSPVIIKWHFANYSEPLDGYETIVIDPRDYWARKRYDPASGENAASPYPGRASQHLRYLEATRKLGMAYIPRFEWGGSQDLPEAAWAIDANGRPAKPNRYSSWCANLLHPATWEDLKKLMDHLVRPYAQNHPQLAGVLWRIRCNRLPISYGPDDIRLFSEETNTPLPGDAYEQQAAWVTGEAKAEYDAWWHRKRAEFHGRLADLLRSYRPDLTLCYYNWDPDKFGIIEPDITAWAFVKKVVEAGPEGGRAVYERERRIRRGFTAEDYIRAMRTGNFGNAFGGLERADLGIRPELYRHMSGIRIFAPVNYLCYADKPAYLNYFQTADGLAVSHCVSYDEIGARSINPKYEGNMIVPGGAPFSMALELLAWFHGDVRTLSYTVYTYGRGFADAHRRFAQAFLALPAIPGTVVDQGDDDVKVRIYPSANGTYVGVAYKGHVPRAFTVGIPAADGARVTDLVAGGTLPARGSAGKLSFRVASGPMELNAYLVK